MSSGRGSVELCLLTTVGARRDTLEKVGCEGGPGMRAEKVVVVPRDIGWEILDCKWGGRARTPLAE